MKSAKAIGTRTMRLRFTGMYLASVVIIGVIVSAFWDAAGNLLPQTGKAVNSYTATPGADNSSKADEILHNRLYVLQQVNERLAGMPANERRENSELIAAEQGLIKSMDSLENAAADYSAAEKEKLHALLESFKLTLRTLQMVNAEPVAAPTAVATPASDKSAEYTAALAKREERIKDLEQQLKLLKDVNAAKTMAVTSANTSSTGNQQLKAALAALEKKNAALKRQADELKRNNELLSAQLRSMQRN